MTVHLILLEGPLGAMIGRGAPRQRPAGDRMTGAGSVPHVLVSGGRWPPTTTMARSVSLPLPASPQARDPVQSRILTERLRGVFDDPFVWSN